MNETRPDIAPPRPEGDQAAAENGHAGANGHHGQSARAVEALLNETRRITAEGGEAIARMQHTIREIKSSSDQTSKIIRTIDDIAMQTKLLAINASVEAARAGEAGRGFAVVASEVGKLAEMSAEAAQTTSDSIAGSQRMADQGVQVATEVGDLLNKVSAAVQLNNDLIFQKTRIESFIGTIESDLAFLQATPPVAGILRALSNRGVDREGHSTLAEWRQRLEVIFAGFAQAKTHYRKARFILDNGDELVSVVSDGRSPRALAGQQLENVGREEYFRQALRQSPGSMHIAPMELSRVNGKIETPHVPILRYALPVFPHGGEAAGRGQGIMVLDVFAERFLDELRTRSPHRANYLVDEEGFFLVHPRREMEWGMLLGQARHRLQHEFPEHHRGFLSGQAGLLTDVGGWMTAFSPLYIRKREQHDWVLLVASRNAPAA